MEKTKINGDFIDKETNERENRDTLVDVLAF